MSEFYGLGSLERDLSGVRVDGIRRTIADLRRFAPELLQEMNEEIKDITSPFVLLGRIYAKQAGSSNGAPLSRWNYQPRRPGSRGEYATAQGKSGAKRWEYDRLRWNTGKVTRGIRSGPGGFKFANNVNVGSSNRWTSLWAIRNSNPAGAVYELMGSGKSTVPMVGSVRGRHGRSKRLIWRAWDELRGEQVVPRAIENVVVKYVEGFNQKLGLVGPRRPAGSRKTYTFTPAQFPSAQ